MAQINLYTTNGELLVQMISALYWLSSKQAFSKKFVVVFLESNIFGKANAFNTLIQDTGHLRHFIKNIIITPITS